MCTKALVPYVRTPSALYRSAGFQRDLSQEAALMRLDGLAAALPRFVRAQRAFAAARARAHAAADAAVGGPQPALAPGLWASFRRLLHARTDAARDRAFVDACAEEGCALPPQPPHGIYLWGDVGSGKTTLMDILFDAVSSAMSPGSVSRLHFQTFMLGVYTRLHEFDEMTVAEREDRGLEHPLDCVVSYGPGLGLGAVAHGRKVQAPSEQVDGCGGLLCFDEFQVNDVADARLLQGVLERLMDQGIVLVMTANRPPSEVDRSQLREDSDFGAFVDFLGERCALVQVGSGLDYRERMHAASEKSTRSIFPASETSEAMLRDRWREEGGCEWDEVVSVNVRVAQGRSFKARRASPLRPAAQFRLEELVQRAVGPADYIALARRFKVLFITDVVPPLSASTRDAARRWVWLVDALYAHGSRLVMRIEGRNVAELFSADRLIERDPSAIAEGLQFEGEVSRKGVGADNRDLTGGGNSRRAFEQSMATLFTGEDERFALKRAASRLLEMQTDAYRCGTRQNFG